MTMSIQHTHFVLREARDVSELVSLFHLRYQGYLESSCASLVRQNPHGLEFDSYDWNAYHLGLFQEGRYGAKPIGYMRLVQGVSSAMAPMVSALAAKFPGLAPPPPPPEGAPLPMIASCPKKGWLLWEYRRREALGQKMIEGSRFVFSADIRAAGYARFVFEGSMVNTFYRYGCDYALLACHPRHAPFYLRYGFTQLLDGSENDYKGLSASILGLERGGISPERSGQIEAMASLCRPNGAIYLLPGNRQAAKVAVNTIKTA